MQPRKTLTKEMAQVIAADALREVGLERQAWMIEDPLRLELTELLAQHPTYDRESEYDEMYCVTCGSSDFAVHYEHCFILHVWKYLGDPRYQAHLERVAQEEAEAARRKAAREEHERTRCGASRGMGERCRLRTGHEGEHSFSMSLSGLNSMFKSVYGSGSMFGLDRNADTVRLAGTEFKFQSDSVDAQIYALDNIRSVIPSVIESPYVKEGTAYLLSLNEFNKPEEDK